MNILTCGVYDLFHVGHLDFLKSIKKQNDKLFILIHSNRFVSTYKRNPIIDENDRSKIVSELRIVDDCFIDDNEYITDEILMRYNINIVIHAIPDINKNIWKYYFHIPIKNNIMSFIKYNNNQLSTTNIIEKTVQKFQEQENRYSRENIFKNEQLYGSFFQSPCTTKIFADIPIRTVKNILDIGCGLGGNSIHFTNLYECQAIALDISKR